MHINKKKDRGRHQRGLISSFYDYCPFSKKLANHNSMQKKEDKVGHKTANKEEKQRKKWEREKDRNRFGKKIQILARGHAWKTKKLFIYVRVVGKYAFFVAFLYLLAENQSKEQELVRNNAVFRYSSAVTKG